MKIFIYTIQRGVRSAILWLTMMLVAIGVKDNSWGALLSAAMTCCIYTLTSKDYLNVN
jgi:hypothetical protein